MYTFDARVRFSEVGENGLLSLQSLLDYFQDCSTFHSEDVGLGVDYFKKIGQVWLLSAWQICVRRYPRLGERMVVGTAPYAFRGFLGYRNFLMRTEAGEKLACANSIWALMDLEKGRPAKPTAQMLSAYCLEERHPMPYADRKIGMPAVGREMDPLAVKPHHLDTNHHVNNGQYVRMAMDCAQPPFAVRQLRAEYKSQARLGDVVYPVVCGGQDGLCTVALNGAQGEPYCIVEFSATVWPER